jgi:hypothetical protein
MIPRHVLAYIKKSDVECAQALLRSRGAGVR